MSTDQTQLALIIIGVIVGIAGIVLLSSSKRERRTVGIFLFPLLPALLLFLITFRVDSTSTIDVIGSFSGPIAAYVGLIILLGRYINKDTKTGDRDKEFTDTKSQNETQTLQLKDLTTQLNEITAERDKLRESTETSRPKPLQPGDDISYRVASDKDQLIILRTGDVRNIRNIDVLVNSENTDMMPARYYDRSMSGTLRYLDAKKSDDGRVVQDNLALSLTKYIEDGKLQLPVQPGIVIPTETLGLRDNGVRYVFHVAAVQGTVGAGYEPITSQLNVCVENALGRVEQLNKELAAKNEPLLQSILMPLFGAGTAKMSPQEAADIMINEIVRTLQYTPTVKKVYVLAFIESHRVAIRAAAEKLKLAPK